MTLKGWLASAGTALLSFLLLILHVRTRQVERLKAEKATLKDEAGKAETASRHMRNAHLSAASIQAADDAEIKRRYDDIFGKD